ncbi:hypothetical protein N9P07_05230 [Alphaproteobacteria bacterium]|nr:hypothetical protein [Alphaproteobacteria bacterium]
MQPKLILHPLSYTKVDRFIRVGFKVEYKGSQVKHIWIDYPEYIKLPDESVCNAYILLIIFEAMKFGLDIEVMGIIDKKLLSNLREYILLWAMWYPHLYKKINISANTENIGTLKLNGSILAFSGGLDAAFSAHNFYNKKDDFEKLKCGVFVQGLDIPLQKTFEFRIASQKAAIILKSINIPIIQVRTNFKIQSTANYEHSHATAIIGIMSNLISLGNQLIIGSSDWYNKLEIPWGSSPLSDFLLGSSEYTVIHDGCGHTRTQKMAALRDWPEALNNLRVCWRGEDKSKNCMNCEKCFRTFMHFKANNMKTNSNLNFSGDISEKLSSIGLANDKKPHYFKYYEDLYIEAKRNKVKDVWVDALGKIIGFKDQ